MFNMSVDDNPGKLPIGEVEKSMDEFISPVTELLPDGHMCNDGRGVIRLR